MRTSLPLQEASAEEAHSKTAKRYNLFQTGFPPGANFYLVIVKIGFQANYSSDGT